MLVFLILKVWGLARENKGWKWKQLRLFVTFDQKHLGLLHLLPVVLRENDEPQTICKPFLQARVEANEPAKLPELQVNPGPLRLGQET